MAFPARSASATITMMAKIRRPNPFPAFRFGAVVAVSIKKPRKFLIPSPLKVIVE